MPKFIIFYAKSLRYAPYQTPETSNPLDYRKVGEVEVESLGEVFRVMNAVDGTELCCQMGVRSMSMGDIAVDEDGVAHYCAATSWGETRFVEAVNPSQFLTSDGYRLTWTGRVWTEQVMTFEGDEQGPIDCYRNRVEGDLL